jgi:23S rRNA (uracil1939-C5)-methyltransferase
VEKAAAGGRMIARHGGAVVLVAGAIPGEQVEARVEKVQRGTIWARTTRVLERSADRVEVQTPADCGGAVFAHVAYERQLVLKREILVDAFARIGKMAVPREPPVLASPQAGYRMRARLHVQGSNIGFYREGSHQLCDAGATGQLLPATVEVIDRIAAALAGEPGHPIIEIELAEDAAGTTRAAHLVLAERAPAFRSERLAALEGLAGLSAAAAGASRVTTLSGAPFVVDRITVPAGSVSVAYELRRHAHAFFQGNRFLIGPLVGRVLAHVVSGRLLDLYAGVGLFSVAAAAAGHDVLAVEGDRCAADDLQHNAVNARASIAARHASVETIVLSARDERWSTVIVDPPRAGLSKEALAGLLALSTTRLVYVSCDPATLARDARQFVDAGYELRHLEAFDLFPGTAHVEALAVFER